MALRLRIERERQGLTQRGLSERTGIAQSDISQIERGKKEVFPAWASRIKDALGMGDELFGEVKLPK